MKLSVFIVSILCAIIVVTGCKGEISSDCKKLGLNKVVKSVQVKTYEAESKFGEIIRSDSDCGYLALFDADGNLTSITDFDAEGELDGKTVYEYDEKNHIVKFVSYDWDGEMVFSVNNVYDGKYLIKTQSVNSDDIYLTEYKRNGESIQEYSYSVNGEVKEIAKYLESNQLRSSYIVYDNTGKEIRTVQQEFDKYGNLLKKTISTGVKEETTTYAYNKAGYLTEVLTSDYKGEIRYNDKNLPVYVKGGVIYYNTDVYLDQWYEDDVYSIEYEYDNKGNWIKQIVYEGEMKEPHTISERTIFY